MTPRDFLYNYLDFMWCTFSHDMVWYYQDSHWNWYYFLVPIILYTIFFVFKWVILLIPFWFPMILVSKTIVAFSPYSIDKKD